MKTSLRNHLAMLPLMLWLGCFLMIPCLMILLLSFAQKGAYGSLIYEWNLNNYLRILDPLYLKIYGLSLAVAMVTALLCLAFALPVAYLMARAPRQYKSVLLVMVMLPFLTNFIIRAHGLKILLGQHGPILAWIRWTGILGNEIQLTESMGAVVFGMVTNYLPFMILPIYSALERFDFSLLEAAQDLGASRLKSLVLVLLPNLKAAIFAGCVLVYMPAFGEFIIPDFLGGARVMLLGNLISDQFLKARDWPFGSALSVLMLVSVIVPVFALVYADGCRQHQKAVPE